MFSPRLGDSRGIALISSMMVIAIVAASSTWLVRSQIINVQRSERVIGSEKAFVIALGIEDMVRELLLRDLKLDGDNREDYYIRRFDRNGDGYNDMQQEMWSLPFAFNDSPVQGINARWCVHDLSGFIDLNLLASEDKQVRDYTKRVALSLVEVLFRKKEQESFYLQFDDTPTDTFDEEDLQAFEELIVDQGIGIDTYALESANALADWFDRDNDLREPGGAEVDEYLDLEEDNPYLPANGIFMAWPDEIRLVKGYHASNDYLSETILPYITAIPVSYDQETNEKNPNPRLYININTTPAVVAKAVLRSRGRPMDDSIDEVFSDKMYPPYPALAPTHYKFSDVDEFCVRIGISSDEKGRDVCDVLKNYFFVTYSRFFQLDVELELGDLGAWSMQSLFYRHPDKAKPDVFVLQRSVDRASHYRKTPLHGWRNCH